jgi:hypothetical protein
VSGDGEKWTKRGPVQMPRGARGSHRQVHPGGRGLLVREALRKGCVVFGMTGSDLGHATRCVVLDPLKRRRLLMFAECANTQVR